VVGHQESKAFGADRGEKKKNRRLMLGRKGVLDDDGGLPSIKRLRGPIMRQGRTGGGSLSAGEGRNSKCWRARMNCGFSSGKGASDRPERQ